MKEKKPKIKNARLRGLVIMIVSACLAVADVVVSAVINANSHINALRAGEVLGILFFALIALVLWFVNGLLLFIRGEKKNPDTQNALEAMKQNEQDESHNPSTDSTSADKNTRNNESKD